MIKATISSVEMKLKKENLLHFTFEFSVYAASGKSECRWLRELWLSSSCFPAIFYVPGLGNDDEASWMKFAIYRGKGKAFPWYIFLAIRINERT